MPRLLIWALAALAMLAPVIAAGFSPLLEYRQPIYITAGFAGVIGMALMLLQPLLAGGVLAPYAQARQVHRWIGIVLVLAVLLHVAGLWITSPPDVIDVLLVRSPTPFGIWGLIAMWAVFLAAVFAGLRRRLPLRLWRWGHSVLVTLAVVGTLLHAVQIDGTMEVVTKWMLALLILAALAVALYRRRVWAMGIRGRGSSRGRSA